MNPLQLITNCTIDLDASHALRSLIIDMPELDDMNATIESMLADYPRLRRIDLEQMRDNLLLIDRETLTELALDHSLCPLHLIDYAICFDDDAPECAAIRTIHPSHDT